MLDETLLRISRDSLGTAEGTCSVCGTFLSISIPTEASARNALLRLFSKHLAQKHPEVIFSALVRETHTLNEEETRLMDQAIAKLVFVGDRVGVTPEEMISMLESGMSVSELLAFLASKNFGAA
jgi:hypothetical protein